MTKRSSLQKAVSTDKVGYANLISRTKSESEKIELTARWTLQEFETYYFESRRIPDSAKEAF